MTDKQPEALRLATALTEHVEYYGDGFSEEQGCLAAAELRRLHEENKGLREAYWKMRNSAAGYSNYCEDSASTRRCERDYEEAESMYRAAIAKATGVTKE